MNSRRGKNMIKKAGPTSFLDFSAVFSVVKNK